MYRNVIGLTSALAILIGTAGFAAISQAHEGDDLCNVLLDGDGEPVKEKDNDEINHSNSHACSSKSDEGDASAAEAPAEKAPQQVALAPVIEPLTVFFDVSRDNLSAGSNAQVQAFADELRETNPKSIKVIGYTDTSGSAELNEQLSKARAANVADALVGAGISSNLIEQGSAGQEVLAVETPDQTREPNNRRVIITPEY